jgi:hypothetical protein
MWMRPVREPLRLPTAEREALMAAAIADAAPECGEDRDRLTQECDAMRGEMGCSEEVVETMRAKRRMERLDWLLRKVEHGKARRRSYCERPGNVIYTELTTAAFTTVPRSAALSAARSRACSPMTIDYRARQEANLCHGPRCSAVANKKLLSMPHTQFANAALAHLRTSSRRQARPDAPTDHRPQTTDRVAAESGLTSAASPCAS